MLYVVRDAIREGLFKVALTKSLELCNNMSRSCTEPRVRGVYEEKEGSVMVVSDFHLSDKKVGGWYVATGKIHGVTVSMQYKKRPLESRAKRDLQEKYVRMGKEGRG